MANNLWKENKTANQECIWWAMTLLYLTFTILWMILFNLITLIPTRQWICLIKRPQKIYLHVKYTYSNKGELYIAVHNLGILLELFHLQFFWGENNGVQVYVSESR